MENKQQKDISEAEKRYKESFIGRLSEKEVFEMGAVSPYPPLGASLGKDEEDKELIEKLKNPPQFEPFNSDLFTDKIAETANKTAQVSHDLEMKRIKAKMIADVTVELIKYNGDKIFPQRIAEIAREIAENALKEI